MRAEVGTFDADQDGAGVLVVGDADLVAILDDDLLRVGQRVVLAAAVGAHLAHDAHVRRTGPRPGKRQQLCT